MSFIIQRRWDHRYMKEASDWVDERERAYEFPDVEAALQFCSDQTLSGIDVVQCGDHRRDDVVVRSIALRS